MGTSAPDPNPSKILGKDPHNLTGLCLGDADFVDAIHTNVYGMGIIQRVGVIDFYVNDPSADIPAAKSIVEACICAIHYFAERNFPAVAANSLKEYKSNDGFGKRTYMGIDVDHDLEGDYILEANSNSPFGKSATAQKQSNFHGVHDSWKSN